MHVNKKIRFIILVSILTFLLAACSSGQSRISPEMTEFSFGDVVNGEILTKEIVVTNTGSAPLVIEGISTSCGCTTAEMDVEQIDVSQSATLSIHFDSGAHGRELTGEFSRQVFIATNDPHNPEIVVKFNANILPPQAD
jgi:hypothetical protein